MKGKPFQHRSTGPARQQGVTTLAIALILLVILSVVVVFATNVGFFEQRTATNENRAKLVDAAADYQLNLAAEFFKVNTSRIINTETGGWLNAASSRWQPCTTAAPAGATDPCLSEPDAARRARLYRYVAGGSMLVPVNDVIPVAGEVTDIGGAGGTTFPVTTQVTATLCRLDVSNAANPVCSLNPATPGQFAVTTVATSTLTNENAEAVLKQTLATYQGGGGPSTPPLVASGSVMGLGNAEIVASPNAGGYGLPISIWSPCPVDIEDSPPAVYPAGCVAPAAGGIGSVSTCHIGEYLGAVPESNMLTTCATTNDCGCPSDDFLSGHFGTTRREGVDVLDRDGNRGLPDITFFPREPYDDPNDAFDDSLFEWIFGLDVVTEGQTASRIDATNCSGDPTGMNDCALHALVTQKSAQTVANCSVLNSASKGLYLVTGTCSLPAQIGTAGEPVVVVTVGDTHATGGSIIYGMLFVYSRDNTATFQGNGNVKVFGSTVVQGRVNLNGGIEMIFSSVMESRVRNIVNPYVFGRLPGSWLDSRTVY